ncbi:hypothetical protein [Oleiharenicola lentus]|uniref:hypothetical protein n=1 Tax=Oleiharenicola lentus TaxID=2508720 RepID=UPI003F676E00
MNPNSPDKDRRWHDLVQRARRDTPPAVNLAALLNSLPRGSARVQPRPSWSNEFDIFFGRRVWLAGGLAACGLCVSGWFLNDALEHDLPWMELVASVDNADLEDGQ